MGTRSLIATKQENGKISSIYCHWDGYPEGVGAVLSKHYLNPDKVSQLMELGNLSSLGAEIGEKQDFNKRNSLEDWCLAYGRDRGETGQSCKEFSSVSSWMGHAFRSDAEFIYLFTNGEWSHWAVNGLPSEEKQETINAQTQQNIKRSLFVEAREWFDKSGGNSYFSARIWADGNLVGILPFQYGYENHYESVALDWLKAKGYLSTQNNQGLGLWSIAKESNFDYYTIKIVVKKSEMFRA